MSQNNKRLTVFSIKEITAGSSGEKRNVWVKAGSAWANRDGSFNVYLDVLPLEGRLHVRDEALGQRQDLPPSREQETQPSGPPPGMRGDSMGGH